MSDEARYLNIKVRHASQRRAFFPEGGRLELAPGGEWPVEGRHDATASWLRDIGTP